jgi:hypothetical protein
MRCGVRGAGCKVRVQGAGCGARRVRCGLPQSGATKLCATLPICGLQAIGCGATIHPHAQQEAPTDERHGGPQDATHWANEGTGQYQVRVFARGKGEQGSNRQREN